MPEKDQVKITPAKGRPMLTWVGKRPLSQITAFPAQHVETFDPIGDAALRSGELWTDWPEHYPRGGLLFHGDNKEVLAHLLANGFRGKVKLVYIDPPFDSGADYVRRVRLRGVAGNALLDGEGYTLGEQIQYEDIWANDNYLQFIYERLLLLKELLWDDGSICFHCDWHRNYHLRCLLDEVFGSDHFRNEIIWRYSKYQMRGMSRFVNNHDVLYWYSKGDDWTYNIITETLETPKKLKRKRWDKESGKIVNVRDEQGNLIYDEYTEGKVDDVWDIDIIGATSSERTDYPTQKPEVLLDRVIMAFTNPGDIVLDAFLGSGTAVLAAQRLGRRWIGCDINKGAIQISSKRLQAFIRDQIATRDKDIQETLIKDNNEELVPAQLSFSIWRVNDYDLQIQHNEATNLVCEHIGIQRARTDAFFDGTLGRSLVKIVPFNHPLSPLDLDEIQRELEARPEEDRNIIVVCLGIELMAQSWIEDWNRLRIGANAVNRIEVIELRTDPRYGKFIQHKPASAKVKIHRQDGKIHVEIIDFISPTIIERLQQQAGILRPQIEDWRAMVDCVMIDPAFDGNVFQVVCSDVPIKKDDLVKGSYTLPAPDEPTVVAVKIIDMLGEEVLISEQV